MSGAVSLIPLRECPIDRSLSVALSIALSVALSIR